MLEFTGERVIPGRVDPDLWNEHLSRYLFASQLATEKRVADLGCGTGYGAAELARLADSVVGIDLSAEAVSWAKENFSVANLRFEQGPCESLPLPDESVDLAVAFEVIEHLARPEALLAEARRILAPNGQLVVSTPNAEYYLKSRKDAGPNPFHHREYTLREFQEVLGHHFPNVELFTQNHIPIIAFRSIGATAAHSPVVHAEAQGQDPESAHFFVAVCAISAPATMPGFLYVPSTGNVLAERELHIDRLQSELAQKQVWLDQSTSEHAALVEQHRRLGEELEAANNWAKNLDGQLAEKIAHVGLLDAELKGKMAELSQIIDRLRTVEADLEVQTDWARSVEVERNLLRERIRLAADSRWLRLGRTIKLGPDLRQ